ncbi:MAG: SDR family NAD(P)-dependent oxidoreductase, partial [Pseudomonadota bacterium]
AALAEHYAADGITLYLTGRNVERLKEVEQICVQKGATVHAQTLDVTSKSDMFDFGADITNENPLDLVIANAGISGGTGSDPDGEPMHQAREIFDINLTGVLNTVEAVLPSMLKAKKGQIALMSSLAGFSGWPGAPAYSASKGAVRLYGEALKGSVKDKGLKVSVICPGFIQTPMTSVNPYKMPFMIDATQAARIIATGLKKNKTRIAFPWPTYAFSGFFGLLPGWLGLLVLSKFPSKPKQ